MTSQTRQSSPIRFYVIFSYALFWSMVLGICGTASIVFHASPLTMRILSNITAWSPTFAVLIAFKKLVPNKSLKEFLRYHFSGKLKASLFLLIPILISGSIAISVFILSLIEKQSFFSYFSLGGYSLALSIILSLTTGPTGEELGWRGYLRPELNKKYGFLKGTIYQGIIWTFWHTILWFLDSEFLDWRIIPYVISNVIVIIAITMIMNIILEYHNNLLYSIWIHFCFNLPYCFLQVNITYYIIMCFVFPITATLCYYYYINHKPNPLKY